MTTSLLPEPHKARALVAHDTWALAKLRSLQQDHLQALEALLPLLVCMSDYTDLCYNFLQYIRTQ